MVLSREDLDAIARMMDIRVGALKQDILESVDQRLEAMEEKMNQRFEAMDQKMNQKFEAMDQKMDHRFEAMEEKMNRRFEAMDQEIAQKMDVQKKEIIAYIDKNNLAIADVLTEALEIQEKSEHQMSGVYMITPLDAKKANK